MNAKKLILAVIFLGFIPICLCGCFEEESPFIVEETIDLLTPNGIYELILFKGMDSALQKIDFSKYSEKKIYYEVQEIIDGYLDNVVSVAIDQRFSDIKANKLIINKSEENKDRSDDELKKETEYDYDLYFTVPVTGVYYYDGFIKKHFISYVSINLVEKPKNGLMKTYSSGIINTEFDQFIPSRYFLISMWVLLISVILSIMGLTILKIYFLKGG